MQQPAHGRARPAPQPKPVETAVFDGRRTVTRYAPGCAPPPLPPAPVVRRPPPSAAADASADPSFDRTRAAEDKVLHAAFADIQREVERFGVGGLEKKERGAWEQRRLASLGIAPPTKPRIPAFIGLGMARKAREREETARLAEAVQGGRLAKKRKVVDEAEERAARRERGAAWGGDMGDVYRGGVLKLAAPEKEAVREVLPRVSGKNSKGRNKAKLGGKKGGSKGGRKKGGGGGKR